MFCPWCLVGFDIDRGRQTDGHKTYTQLTFVQVLRLAGRGQASTAGPPKVSVSVQGLS